MSVNITRIKILSLSDILFLDPLLFFFCAGFCFDEYAAGNVKTVFFEKEGWRLAYPFVQINRPEQIILHFDIIDGEGGITMVPAYTL